MKEVEGQERTLLGREARQGACTHACMYVCVFVNENVNSMLCR